MQAKDLNFCSLVENWTCAEVKDFFFALHSIFSGKKDIFFALSIRATLGFKIFSNAALRVKNLPIPSKLTWSIFGSF